MDDPVVARWLALALRRHEYDKRPLSLRLCDGALRPHDECVALGWYACVSPV